VLKEIEYRGEGPAGRGMEHASQAASNATNARAGRRTSAGRRPRRHATPAATQALYVSAQQQPLPGVKPERQQRDTSPVTRCAGGAGAGKKKNGVAHRAKAGVRRRDRKCEHASYQPGAASAQKRVAAAAQEKHAQQNHKRGNTAASRVRQPAGFEGKKGRTGGPEPKGEIGQQRKNAGVGNQMESVVTTQSLYKPPSQRQRRTASSSVTR